MIVAIAPDNFLKCQKSIEKTNLKNPSEKILVVDSGNSHRHSHISGMLLKAYYSKLEKNPDLGLNDREFNLFIKNQINEDNKFTCAYCSKQLDRKQITIDHYKPRVFKGKNQYFNLRMSCESCNVAKGGIHPMRMPISFNCFLEKVKEQENIRSIDILVEVKTTSSQLMDEIEKSMLDRLIAMEHRWRTEYEKRKSNKLESSNPSVILNNS